MATNEDDTETVEHLLQLSDKLLDAEVPYEEERDMASEGQMEDMLQDYEYKHPELLSSGEDE